MKRRRRSGGEMEKIGKDEGERSGLEIGEEWVGEKNGLGRNKENRER